MRVSVLASILLAVSCGGSGIPNRVRAGAAGQPASSWQRTSWPGPSSGFNCVMAIYGSGAAPRRPSEFPSPVAPRLAITGVGRLPRQRRRILTMTLARTDRRRQRQRPGHARQPGVLGHAPAPGQRYRQRPVRRRRRLRRRNRELRRHQRHRVLCHESVEPHQGISDGARRSVRRVRRRPSTVLSTAIGRPPTA